MNNSDAINLRYFVGLDLGQAADYTALVVLERPRLRHDTPAGQRKPVYALRHINRFYLGTPYPEIVANVAELLRKPPLHAVPGQRRPFLVVDRTGVGRPVVDMLHAALVGKVNCRCLGVSITSGNSVTAATTGAVNVPKKDLVGALQALLQTRRLQVVRTLPEARVLVKELESFRVKVTLAANETYEAWREGDHDDLVLATALAAWVGEQCLAAELTPPVRPSRLAFGAGGHVVQVPAF